MILKKIGMVLTALLTMLVYQNCSNFNGDVTSVSKSGTTIDSFELNIKEYPYAAPSTKVTTKITAGLEEAVGVNGQVTIFKDRFIITHHQTSQSPYSKCVTTYAVTRDDIRNLLKAMDEMEVIELSAPSGMQVADLAIYELILDKGTSSIRLGGHNVVVGQRFTLDLNLSDFITVLNENDSKVISAQCAVE